ncbi:hypothetical protein PROVRETT_09890 [Providencia rettgeri DSM 1131]|nr:hypothetical protein PROVRETT_09890 [Providencia rettgeri DSM 1131]
MPHPFAIFFYSYKYLLFSQKKYQIARTSYFLFKKEPVFLR